MDHAVVQDSCTFPAAVGGSGSRHGDTSSPPPVRQFASRVANCLCLSIYPSIHSRLLRCGLLLLSASLHQCLWNLVANLGVQVVYSCSPPGQNITEKLSYTGKHCEGNSIASRSLLTDCVHVILLQKTLSPEAAPPQVTTKAEGVREPQRGPTGRSAVSPAPHVPFPNDSQPTTATHTPPSQLLFSLSQEFTTTATCPPPQHPSPLCLCLSLHTLLSSPLTLHTLTPHRSVLKHMGNVC
ncbi:hypothetical protein E2C01_095481 [Portunus trituberculatus]|uniref:Uncharacterized protein n=1 Tax=Portunus trituberculatus TaxID=210409 RepID=A0A5B7JVD3_PORTR|nr:hypothetical protein [Portunus trituberculatus]